MRPKQLFMTFLLTLSPSLQAGNSFDFTPLDSSAYREQTRDPEILNSKPFLLPDGFTQRILADETDLDIYVGNDWMDMNTLNQSGRDAGRYLYRTHEVKQSNDTHLDGNEGGSLSVVDLQSGKATLLATREDWEAVDGILWTPWKTLLFSEEQKSASSPDPEHPAIPLGLVYELTLDPESPDRMLSVASRPQLGSLTHEGIEVDEAGNLYVIDESHFGGIYRFVPEEYGKLDKGQLYALKVAQQEQTGKASWIPLQLDQETFNARKAAREAGATSWCRPEDIERIDSMLYVALTCEQQHGAVLSITLGTETPDVRYFVRPGINVSTETLLLKRTGFRNPDNLANGPGGRLWITEDNAPGDIWVADPDENGDGYSDRVSLFASLKDRKAEPSGIYFGQEPARLFVSIQHSVTGNDKTVVIEKIVTGQ